MTMELDEVVERLCYVFRHARSSVSGNVADFSLIIPGLMYGYVHPSHYTQEEARRLFDKGLFLPYSRVKRCSVPQMLVVYHFAGDTFLHRSFFVHNHEELDLLSTGSRKQLMLQGNSEMGWYMPFERWAPLDLADLQIRRGTLKRMYAARRPASS